MVPAGLLLVSGFRGSASRSCEFDTAEHAAAAAQPRPRASLDSTFYVLFDDHHEDNDGKQHYDGNIRNLRHLARTRKDSDCQ